MAFVFDESDGLSRTSSPPALNAVTAMTWIFLDAGNSPIFFSHESTGGDFHDVYLSAGVLELYHDGGPATGSTLSSGVWYHICYWSDGTNVRVYLNGVQDISASYSAGVSTATDIEMSSGGSSNTIRHQAVKMWSAALSVDEIQREMRQNMPFRRDNLYSWTPGRDAADATVDYSGNGQAWTQTGGGNLTTADGPPLPWRVTRRRMTRFIAPFPDVQGLVIGSELSFVGEGVIGEDDFGAALVKVLNETEQIPETIVRLKTLLKILNETEQISETIVRLKAMVRILNEVEQISETTPRLKAMVRIVTETENLAETIVRLKAMVRVVSETEQIPENVVRLKAMVRIINEVENLVEQVTRLRGLLKIVNETENIGEIIVRFKTLIRVLNETEQIPETIVRSRTLRRVLNETENLVETIVRARTLSRIVNEIEQIPETIVRIRAMAKVINEVERITETAFQVMFVPSNVARNINVFLDTLDMTILLDSTNVSANLSSSNVNVRGDSVGTNLVLRGLNLPVLLSSTGVNATV